MSRRRLPRRFFARDATLVAPDLLGCLLVVGDGTDRVEIRIDETEAYTSDDPASHSFRGETPRNKVMFGPPGHMYTYFTYGMHWCANVVTGSVGDGQAVLLRGGRIEHGLELALRRRWSDGRRRPSERDLANGPAKLAVACGIGGEHNGLDLCRSSSSARFVVDGVPRPSVATMTRIGISVGTDRPWRFVAAGASTRV